MAQWQNMGTRPPTSINGGTCIRTVNRKSPVHLNFAVQVSFNDKCIYYWDQKLYDWKELEWLNEDADSDEIIKLKREIEALTKYSENLSEQLEKSNTEIDQLKADVKTWRSIAEEESAASRRLQDYINKDKTNGPGRVVESSIEDNKPFKTLVEYECKGSFWGVEVWTPINVSDLSPKKLEQFIAEGKIRKITK